MIFSFAFNSEVDLKSTGKGGWEFELYLTDLYLLHDARDIDVIKKRKQ